MKKILCISLATILTFGFGNLAFASEADTITDDSVSGMPASAVIINVDENGNVTATEPIEPDVVIAQESAMNTGDNSNSPGISANGASIGLGGLARIEWLDYGRSIYWKVTPSVPNRQTSFMGEITIRDVSTNKKVKTLPVSDYGKGSLSDTEDVGYLKRGKTYIATLTGTGTCGSEVWYVKSGCNETYYKRY